MTPTNAVTLWARVCIYIVVVWIVIFIGWAIVATISPATFGITPLDTADIAAFFGLGLAGIAWYGSPIFLIGAGVLWAFMRGRVALRAAKEYKRATEKKTPS